MRRRFAGLAAAALLACLAGPAAAQQMPLVGFLSGASEQGYTRFAAAFREGLGELGYIAGRNVRIDYRWGDGHPERLPALAGELVREGASVIAAVGGPAAPLAAKGATATIPIVFLSGSDPIAQGLVTNLSRPTGNLTGFTFFAAELAPKRLELLRELMHRPETIAVLGNPKGRDEPPALRLVQTAAEKLGQKLLVLEASSAGELDRAFAAIAAADTKALLILADPFFVAHRDQLGALSARAGVAAICPGDAYAAACLATYGPELAQMYHAVGRYVSKILAGGKPADLPVERATQPQFIINLKIAKALGVTVPPSLLARADEVIE